MVLLSSAILLRYMKVYPLFVRYSRYPQLADVRRTLKDLLLWFKVGKILINSLQFNLPPNQHACQKLWKDRCLEIKA